MTKQFCVWLTMLALMLPATVWGATGIPEPWQMNMTGGFSAMKHRLNDFHNMLLIIITLIVIVVFTLMAVIMIRFNHRANPTPSRTTHHTGLEVAWTVIPVLILLGIAVPSFRLLYFLDRTPEAEMTVKVTGHQWYWSYEYPDQKIVFDSLFQEDQEPRQYAVDNQLVLPINTNVRILVASSDVMHSWLVPPLGVQLYATPGRTNETWVRIDEEGTFYGQCNQICGVNHGFMPITIIGVAKDKFPAWLEEAKKKYAKNDDAATTRLASSSK